MPTAYTFTAPGPQFASVILQAKHILCKLLFFSESQYVMSEWLWQGKGFLNVLFQLCSCKSASLRNKIREKHQSVASYLFFFCHTTSFIGCKDCEHGTKRCQTYSWTLKMNGRKNERMNSNLLSGANSLQGPAVKLNTWPFEHAIRRVKWKLLICIQLFRMGEQEACHNTTATHSYRRTWIVM